MRDRPVIYAGLLIFLALFTWPMWRNLAARATTTGPRPTRPAHEKQCIAPVAYMRSSHMRLLLDWRNSAVRQGARDLAAFDGRHYRMSLTGTCLTQCHGTKADFCDRCHDYAAVSLRCWDCHHDPPPVLRSAR